MARLITSGFEWNDLANGAVAGHPDPFTASNVDTTVVASGQRSGGFCGQCAYGGVSATFFKAVVTTTTTTTYYFRTYFSLSSLPNVGNVYVARLIPTTLLMNAKVWPDGTINLSSSAGGAVVVSTNTFYRLELKWSVDTSNSANNVGELQIDGVTAGTLAPFGTSLATEIDFGVAAVTSGPAAATVLVDDVALNDSTGAAQNSWPGDSKIVLLRPTADSAVGTGWTLGNTTATGGNAWSRLNKAPPDSAADLTTAADADQIRNATSNANVNYDATMTTYTAAGVTGTVNVLVPQVATGAPVVTSAKAGTVGVVSNPAITNVSLGAGGTSGAFWSGVAMGTYPTGNKWSFGTTTYAPTVTLGTAPVMRVTQVTASTRIAIVTEMGIYVDYTPAVAVLPPLPFNVDFAVARSTSY